MSQEIISLASSNLLGALDHCQHKGVCITNEDGNFMYANSGMEELFGYKPEELVHQSFELLVPSDDIAWLREYYQDGFKKQRKRWRSKQWLLQTKNGSQKFCRATGNLFMGEDHRPYLVTFIEDVSTFVEQQQELQDENKTLAAINRQKTDYLAYISHEIRTPLQILMGFSDALQMEIFGPLGDTRYKEYVNDVHSTAHDLSQMINTLLDFTKSELGFMPYNPTEFYIDHLIDECLRQMQGYPSSQQKNLSYHFENKTVDLWIQGDPLLLKQVFLNILSNSAKYSPAHSKIIVTSRLKADNVIVFDFYDEGAGFPENMTEIKPYIYNKDSSKGTGLGLYFSQHILQKHGGTVSIPHCGTCNYVSITIPVVAQSHAMRA